MAGFDRSRISLGRRTQQQTDTRDDNGGIGRQGFMNYSSSGLKFFKLGDVGTYHDLNILPWRIGTKNHPEVVAGNAKVGDFDYVLDLMVHTRIGPGNGDYICPKKNFGKPCPICDRADELWKNEDTKDEARALFAKRKCVYLVQELNDNFHAKSEVPLIYETAHATFSKELQSRATSCLRGKGVVNFADPDEGKVVSFSVNEGTMGNGKKFKQAGNFEFNERTEEVSDEILEACPSLDAMMVIKTPEQLKAAMYGDPEDAEEDFNNQQDEAEEQTASARFRDNNPPARFEDDEPAERPRRRAVAENAEDEAPAPRRRAAAPQDETDDEAPAPRRRNAEEAQDEAPAPRRRKADDESESSYQTARRNARKSVDTEEVAANDNPTMPFDDEPQDEAPAETPKASRGASEGECPNGYEYGVDCDAKPLCAKCNDNIWSKCSECKRRLKSK